MQVFRPVVAADCLYVGGAGNGHFFASFLRLLEARRRNVALAVQQGQARIFEVERVAAEDCGDICGGAEGLVPVLLQILHQRKDRHCHSYCARDFVFGHSELNA